MERTLILWMKEIHFERLAFERGRIAWFYHISITVPRPLYQGSKPPPFKTGFSKGKMWSPVLSVCPGPGGPLLD